MLGRVPWVMTPSTMFRTGLALFLVGVFLRFITVDQGGWVSFWGSHAWASFLMQLLLTGLVDLGIGLIVGSFVLIAVQHGVKDDEKVGRSTHGS